MRVRWSVREARKDDLEAVRQMFIEYQTWLGVDECFQNYDSELDTLPGAYAPPKGNLFVAFLDQNVVGCAGIRELIPGVCELKRLFVREEARGHGIGTALTRRALREARKLGYQSLRLDTLARMEPAIKLYRGLGFQTIGPYYECVNPDVLFLERAVR